MTRSWKTAFAAAALASLAWPAFAQGPAPAAGPAVPEAESAVQAVPGRYVIVTVPDAAGPGAPAVFLLDSEFGRTWQLVRDSAGNPVWSRPMVRRFEGAPAGFLGAPPEVTR